MQIRSYRPEDRPAVAWVFYRAVREGAAAFYDEAQRVVWAPSAHPDPDRPDKLLDQWCWVAEDADGLKGVMSLEPGGYLDMAFVLPEVMGKGVAGALYAALIEGALAEGERHLTVRASHLARRFFQKRGWRIDAAEDYETGGQVFETFMMSIDLGHG